MKETNILQLCRLMASKCGAVVFRNNVGGLEDINGRFVSFGLCPGSSDLIGWKSIVVTPEMVGKKIAVFVAAEVKIPGEKAKPEQQNFIDVIKNYGGISGVVTSEEEMQKLLLTPFE